MVSRAVINRQKNANIKNGGVIFFFFGGGGYDKKIYDK